MSEPIRGAVAISAVIAVCSAAMAHVSSQDANSEQTARDEARLSAPPPVPPPLLLRDVVPQDAININRTIPFSPDPNVAARPFKASGDRASFNRAVECLATAIHYEAGNEPLDGQRAVAQVVLNRVRHPAFVPSVCGVVYQGSTRATGCQFSFTCDGSQRRPPSASGWARARAIAAAALAGSVYAPVGYATHYHADYVVPYWATSLAKKKVVGRHIFYGWPEWWGTAPAFARKHAGNEPDPRALRATAFARSLTPEAVGIEAPQTPPEPDPRVELMRVVQFLAKEPAAAQAAGEECALRRHFGRYSDHVAVQIYRQLSADDSRFESKEFLELLTKHSEPPALVPAGKPSRQLVSAIGGNPKLTGFMASLRDFAKQSDFEAYMKERRSEQAVQAGGSTQKSLTCEVREAGAGDGKSAS